MTCALRARNVGGSLVPQSIRNAINVWSQFGLGDPGSKNSEQSGLLSQLTKATEQNLGCCP